MKEFLEYIVKNIVKHPDEMKIEETVEGSIVRILIKPAKEDMGVVIGKEGRTINNIRALARAKAIKDNVKVYVDISEDGESEEAESTNS
ncbi:KH domain-containing protein [Candidatus Nomurabacteria bacterium]|uniref:RNA-binding protein KhpA n=1 Tax=candidate division WWE3 bacterium TaxID=2053526 RepID=A0A955IWE0_UNCKA|nr:KH domain-containing protein [candidate division WWE3 bacterium]MCB9823729.1 KH domain-containing protein [Candidatus Nomurabacteria bacterium]MCB9827192.1 KH domain-containing protein [Candidatus Nomurabacteria bacterium]MCB9827524.1 KH domain-containing protein [Candidatus Nomurabacteria bacterium]HXK52919.1 KH domain-containing protein [bacterium]